MLSYVTKSRTSEESLRRALTPTAHSLRRFRFVQLYARRRAQFSDAGLLSLLGRPVRRLRSNATRRTMRAPLPGCDSLVSPAARCPRCRLSPIYFRLVSEREKERYREVAIARRCSTSRLSRSRLTWLPRRSLSCGPHHRRRHDRHRHPEVFTSRNSFLPHSTRTVVKLRLVTKLWLIPIAVLRRTTNNNATEQPHRCGCFYFVCVFSLTSSSSCYSCLCVRTLFVFLR